MWQSIINAVRKWPVAQWIKPIWKGALQEGVQRGGDAFQREIGEQLVARGDKALPAIQEKIDGLQARMGKAIDGLPLPVALEAQIKEAIAGPVDALQAQLTASCAHGCAIKARAAFDAAFDKFQADVKARIAAL